MLKKIFGFVVVLSAVSSLALASTARLVNGAGTLSAEDMALSLNGGFDLPAPLVAGIAFDYGVTDRFQLGVDASFGGLLYGAGLRSTFNFWQSEGEGQYLSLRFGTHYTHVYAVLADFKMLTLDPTLAYEVRWGEQDGGVFVKVGTLDSYVSAGSNVLNSFFGSNVANQTLWTHALRTSLGAQYQVSEHFAVSLEGGYIFDLSKAGNSPCGQLGLTWGF